METDPVLKMFKKKYPRQRTRSKIRDTHTLNITTVRNTQTCCNTANIWLHINASLLELKFWGEGEEGGGRGGRREK
jgi:hypothetical protein